MTPADLLEQAAEKVRAGWCQGTWSMREPDGRVSFCARGALEESHSTAGVASYLSLLLPAERALRRYTDGMLIPQWNDDPGRTQDQVVDAFLKAAKDLRNAEAPT